MTNAPRPHGLSRRHVLTTGLGVAGAAALWSTGTGGTAHAAPADDSRWRDENSANGWPVVGEADSYRIEGSGLDVRLLAGDVSVVLLHVARRYHYEIHELRRGEVTGHLTERAVVQPCESNHLSGTAIALRPGAHPVAPRTGSSRSNWPPFATSWPSARGSSGGTVTNRPRRRATSRSPSAPETPAWHASRTGSAAPHPAGEPAPSTRRCRSAEPALGQVLSDG